MPLNFFYYIFFHVFFPFDILSFVIYAILGRLLMAIITVSRKVASLGDETSNELAKILGYKFVERKELEQCLINKGMSNEKLKKYDEKRPSFWASLSKDRDEYFDLLREVVYEIANKGNSIFIGRGGFAILRNIPGVYTVRLVSDDETRLKRIQNEFKFCEAKAKDLIKESDSNREGFHKCFFNVEQEEATFYNMVLNTSEITCQEAAQVIKNALEITIKDEDVQKGKKRIRDLYEAQKIVNHISFKLHLSIYFLDAEVVDDSIVLHGIADSPYTIEKAVNTTKELCKEKKVTSDVKLINDYNNKHY